MSGSFRGRSRVLVTLCTTSALAMTALGISAPAQATVAAGGSTASVPVAANAGPNRATFSHRSIDIDNRWLPFVPGTKYMLEGRVDETAHTVVLVVTDLVKVIDGVRTVVLWDRDFNEGVLEEAELAFQAQDDEGTVWNFGEYPEEHEVGEPVAAPSTWISGLQQARGGPHMLARPRLGTPRYVQGVAPRIDFLDTAKVSATNQHVCVAQTCYDDVLVVDETSPLEPDSGHQLKYYAPGVGNVRVGAVGGQDQEFLDLVSVSKLGPAELARAREAALKLERRAYQISDVYAKTRPAVRRPS